MTLHGVCIVDQCCTPVFCRVCKFQCLVSKFYDEFYVYSGRSNVIFRKLRVLRYS